MILQQGHLLTLIVVLAFLVKSANSLQSDDQCYNVTCEAMTYPECVRTSENDKTITLNTIYCNNGKSHSTN